jgi:outer membrane phospholipase A
VYFQILFIKIRLIPDTDKRFDIGKLTHRNKPSLPSTTTEIKNTSQSSESILDKLNSVRDILSIIFKSFNKNITVKLTQIHIRVATPDAAQTAILYGAVTGAAACILDLIDEVTLLKPLDESSILIEPDFLSEQSEFKLKILLHITIFRAIRVLLKSFITYYSIKDKSQIYNRKEN